MYRKTFITGIIFISLILLKFRPYEEIKISFLKPYKGKIKNIFIHPGIVNPDKNFKQKACNKKFIFGYNYFITAYEFEKVLKSLYRNNYILIDIKDTHININKNGKPNIIKKELFLPKGKKPFILSIDDANYYSIQRSIGTIHSLAVDKQNNIYGTVNKGNQEKRYHNTSFNILENFIKKHPDFSHNNARGIIGLTGYEGIFGHKINAKNNYKIKQIADWLLEKGWKFASHSYGHIHTEQFSYNHVKIDIGKWGKKVRPYIDKTEIFIYPYGEDIPTNSLKFKYFLKKGFKIFFGVSDKHMFDITEKFILIDRMPIDGMVLNQMKKGLLKLELFDVEYVFDPARPVIKRRTY